MPNSMKENPETMEYTTNMHNVRFNFLKTVFYKTEFSARSGIFLCLVISWMAIRKKDSFPLGGILHAERNFSLSFLISSTREITKQRKIPLRAQFRLVENRLN